jgi:hypothetical protein
VDRGSCWHVAAALAIAIIPALLAARPRPAAALRAE